MKKNILKLSWKTEVFPIAVIILSWIAAFYFYPRFPEMVPSHWNIRGEVDNWSSREFGAFFLPVLNLIMYVAFLIFPFLDPKKDRYEDFSKTYAIFRSIIIGALTAIYFIASLSGLGRQIDVGFWVPIIIGAMFVIMGNYMGKIKLNWMVGNRNMWTLSSEEVWNKTNRFSGKMFMASGVIIALESIMPDSWILPTFILAIALVLILPTVYSYVLYSKEKKK